METNARYVRIGLFTLAVIVAGFLFVYWLQGAGGLRRFATYEIRFETPVSGLLKGSAVLFNGIRVGEITEIRLHADDPKRVTVLAAIEPATPVRADTHVEVEFQGLTGATAIALKGGSATKAVLNMISTAAMAASGAVYGNLMVRVRPLNRKLRDRAERLVERIAKVPRARAAAFLRAGGDDVRVAVLMARGASREEAEAALRASGGSLRGALR